MRHVTIDKSAELGRRLREIQYVTAPALPTWAEVAHTWLSYTAVAVGVGVAIFCVAPAHARDVGVMNHEARVIYVSPSVSIYGSKIEQQLKANIIRDNNKYENDSALEDQRSINKRLLEADKAYYKKLADQRKHK